MDFHPLAYGSGRAGKYLVNVVIYIIAFSAKAFELYTRLNSRLKDVHMIHSERIEVIRRSFRQQLQDALVVMATKYKKFYEAKLAGEWNVPIICSMLCF